MPRTFLEACAKLGTAYRPGSKELGPHMATATTHRESVLLCSVLKESSESATKAIRVRLLLHLDGDLDYDYLLLGKRQVRLNASMTGEVLDCRARWNCF